MKQDRFKSQAYTAEQANKLLEAIHGEVLEPVIMLGLLFGMYIKFSRFTEGSSPSHFPFAEIFCDFPTVFCSFPNYFSKAGEFGGRRHILWNEFSCPIDKTNIRMI